MDIVEILTSERAYIGRERGPSGWREVTQDDINLFGACTYDPDPMHIDVAWAEANSPFGGTIAFGFWTLAMTSGMLHEIFGGQAGGDYGVPHEKRIGVNYGCDYLRFIEPVRVGSRIRLWCTTTAIDQVQPDRFIRTNSLRMEIEGCERPALVATWRAMTIVPTAELKGFRSSVAG